MKRQHKIQPSQQTSFSGEKFLDRKIPDGKIQNLSMQVRDDNSYRQNFLSLTASENYSSTPVRLSASSVSGTFYHFNSPHNNKLGEWFFPESNSRQEITNLLRETGKKLFKAQTFDERPSGGSMTEQVILLGLLSELGQKDCAWLHFRPQDGGHFGNAIISQRENVKEFHFPVSTSRLIDLKKLEEICDEHPEIRLAMLDQSHKLRYQDLLGIRQVLPKNCSLVYDCSHDAGLIIGGEIPQPLENGADILIGNTHKTIPGPNKAFIAFADENHPWFKTVSELVCPGLQSNCHAEMTIPLLMTLWELECFGSSYAKQTISNAKTLAQALVNEGFSVVGEDFQYTETHQVHVTIGSSKEALECVSELLPAAGIRANNIAIPGTNDFGLRLGTQAITRRGMKEEHMEKIAKFLRKVFLEKENPTHVKAEVEALLKGFPLFPLPYSFDKIVETELGKDFIKAILNQ